MYHGERLNSLTHLVGTALAAVGAMHMASGTSS